MLKLEAVEVAHIKETLKDCLLEFEELMRTKDWFVTSVVDQIESSLEILDHEDENARN